MTCRREEVVSKANSISSVINNICLCVLRVLISVTSVVKLNHRGHKEGTEMRRVFIK